MTPFLLSRFTATTCLGRGLAAHRTALTDAASGLTRCDFETVQLNSWIGEVAGVDEVCLPASLVRHDCRNNRLALMGLETDGFAEAVRAASVRVGRRRLGVVLGTSTAGILTTELAYRRRDPATGALPADFIYPTTHNTYSVAGFVREYFGLEGLSKIVNVVQQIRDCGANPNLNLEGIVMTMYDSRANLAQQVVSDVRNYFSEIIYNTIIPRTIRLGEAPSFGKSIIEYDPAGRGAQAYRALAEEFLARRAPAAQAAA